MLSVQDACYNCLHSPTSFGAKILNGLVAFLVILTVTVIPLHFIPGIEQFHEGLIFFDKLAVTIFTIEYILRIWSAKKPLDYMFSWWGVIDLIAIVPFYLGQINLIVHPEIFMFLRILRLFKLGKIYSLERSMVAKKADKSHGNFKTFADEEIKHVIQKHWVCFVGSLLFCLILVSTALMAWVLLSSGWFWVGSVAGGILFLIAITMFSKLWMDFNYDLIYVTDKRIILQEQQLFGAQLNEISYDAITNVKPNDASIWHWLFKYGDIHIETAGKQGSLVFSNAAKPRQAVGFISESRLNVARQSS